jgi:hypothetical protein
MPPTSGETSGVVAITVSSERWLSICETKDESVQFGRVNWRNCLVLLRTKGFGKQRNVDRYIVQLCHIGFYGKMQQSIQTVGNLLKVTSIYANSPKQLPADEVGTNALEGGAK